MATGLRPIVLHLKIDLVLYSILNQTFTHTHTHTDRYTHTFGSTMNKNHFNTVLRYNMGNIIDSQAMLILFHYLNQKQYHKFTRVVYFYINAFVFLVLIHSKSKIMDSAFWLIYFYPFSELCNTSSSSFSHVIQLDFCFD